MPRFLRAKTGSALPAVLAGFLCLAIGGPAHAQDTAPAYISFVEGAATLERNGESEPAIRDMPFVQGDRLRTENGRAEIQFPDGTAIEIGEFSLVEAVSPSRVRLLAGTMDHVQGRAAEGPAAMSAAYLPQDLRPYANTFDRDGSWQYAAPYGYVWYPTVTPGWRPYFYGSWSAVPSYGWTWIGTDAWSWPTHHYGRWGYGRNAWYWIPGRTWGAAWVSWASASDYVSWCPLGYDGRPVFALSVIGSDVGLRYREHGWNGWTVMPRGRFGARGSYAHRDAVEPRQLPSNTPFIAQSRPPVGPHQSSVASRQSSVASRQSPVPSPQSPVVSHQPSGISRQAPVGSRQSPAGSHQSAAPQVAPAIGTAIERGQTIPPQGTGYGRSTTEYRRPPTEDRRPTAEDWRLTTPRAAAPRVESPGAPQTPQVTAPEHRRMYPLAVPRGVEPAGVQQRTPPAYQPSMPGYRHPNAAGASGVPARVQAPFDSQTPRIPPAYAVPRTGAPSPPAQHTPAPAPAPAPARAAPVQAPAVSPPPSRAIAPSHTPSQGAASEGTAQQRSGSNGQPAGARRPR